MSESTKELFDFLLQVATVGTGQGAKCQHLCAVAIDEVFVEVPLGSAARDVAQLLVKGIGVFAFDSGFFDHGELHAISETAKIGDLLVIARLLLPKVV